MGSTAIIYIPTTNIRWFWSVNMIIIYWRLLNFFCQVIFYQVLLYRQGLLDLFFCLAGLSSCNQDFITGCVMDCIYLGYIIDYIVGCICLTASACCQVIV